MTKGKKATFVISVIFTVLALIALAFTTALIVPTFTPEEADNVGSALGLAIGNVVLLILGATFGIVAFLFSTVSGILTSTLFGITAVGVRRASVVMFILNVLSVLSLVAFWVYLTTR